MRLGRKMGGLNSWGKLWKGISWSVGRFRVDGRRSCWGGLLKRVCWVRLLRVVKY